MAKKGGNPSFIGIDLAWSDRNPSGVAVIREGRLVACAGGLAGCRRLSTLLAPIFPGEMGRLLRLTRRCEYQTRRAQGRVTARCLQIGSVFTPARIRPTDGCLPATELCAARH